MECRVTAKIKINATPEIVKTLAIYKKALQFCVDTAWKKKIRHKFKLHHIVYYAIRKRFKLHAQLVIVCISQACVMIKTAKSRPIIKNASIGYALAHSFSCKNNVLSIATMKGRIKIPFSVPECYKEYFTWKMCESLLKIDKNGKCYFLFKFSKDIADFKVKDNVIGIDCNVNKLAVTSDRVFYGKQIKGLRIKHDKMVSRLQSKGTKSAKRKLKRISGRWTRFMAWVNHNISKSIVGSVEQNGVFVMEDLNGIVNRHRYKKWVHKWAFRQLQSFVDYKAIRKGCRVVYVNPYNTSVECSVCHNEVVRHFGFVECPSCGHKSDADFNASRNIAQRYMRNMCLGAVTHPFSSHDDSKASFSGTADECRAKKLAF